MFRTYGQTASAGKQTLRLTASHTRLPVLRQEMGTLLHRPFHLLRKQGAPALQRQVERLIGRGIRLHPPHKTGMAATNQLVQTTLVPPRRPRGKVAAIRCGGHIHRPQLATLSVVRPSLRDGLRDGRNASFQEPLLSTSARGARGGRVFRLERRGLKSVIPPWMLMRHQQL